MHSVHTIFVVLLAVLHAFVQVDSKEVATKPAEEKTNSDIQTGSDVNADASANNLEQMIAEYMKNWENYYSTVKRSTRNKRWADYDKRPGSFSSYNSYSPSNSYRRFRYPSNLMALLRGTKRAYTSQPSSRWQYPSNLMVLLRGKKSVDEPIIEEDDDVAEDEDISPVQHEALMDIMTRLADGWQRFINNYRSEMSAKRSAYYGYGGEDAGRISRRPFGSRQFMVWNGGRYILG